MLANFAIDDTGCFLSSMSSILDLHPHQDGSEIRWVAVYYKGKLGDCLFQSWVNVEDEKVFTKDTFQRRQTMIVDYHQWRLL